MKSADAEKRRPPRGEVLAGRSRLPQDEALLVGVLLADGVLNKGPPLRLCFWRGPALSLALLAFAGAVLLLA